MGVWPGSGSEATIFTVMELPPACTETSFMGFMVGGLSTIVRVNCSMTVSSPEEAVMMMVVAPGGTLRPGLKTRVAVPSSLSLNVA